MTVISYCQTLRRARNMLTPDAEAAFVRLLGGSLKGRAYRAIEGCYFISVAEVCARLKAKFDRPHCDEIYRGQLALVKQEPNESIAHYVNRVKDLRSAILEYDHVDMRRIDDLALSCFTRGIDPRVRTELRRRDPGHVLEAFDIAEELASELEDDAEWYNSRRTTYPHDNTKYRDFHRPSRPPPLMDRRPNYPDREQYRQNYYPSRQQEYAPWNREPSRNSRPPSISI
ncbi:hypothetical protein WN48_02574 [Eufriesea mexicana]|uniref:Retrotransposon gag domain-containing protein n=1 Tax=Eufriesea mexicana TaxID=516756 RepID=A0A310S7T7_9HYME|nr:hypothetical protein WN48_02574 [Eufriesea mexicana]